MNYIIYKITNLINNKIYIGKHKTHNINDDYMGSGKYLKRAIIKYGIENFKKEILFVFKTEQEMNDKEAEIVTSEFVLREDTYNICRGGNGGNPSIIGAFTGKTHSAETKEKLRQASFNQVTTDQKRIKLSQNNWAKTNPEDQRIHAINAGLKRAEMYKTNPEIKDKISKTLLGKTQDIVECPHCKKTGGSRAMVRWHFNNCIQLYKNRIGV